LNFTTAKFGPYCRLSDGRGQLCQCGDRTTATEVDGDAVDSSIMEHPLLERPLRFHHKLHNVNAQ